MTEIDGLFIRQTYLGCVMEGEVKKKKKKERVKDDDWE